MSFKKNTFRRLLWAAGFSLALAACEKPAPPVGPEVAQTFVTEWAPSLEQTLSDRTEGASIQADLKAVIEAAAEREKAKTTRDKPPYDQFVKEVYEELEYKPRLVVHGKLTPRGEAIWGAIQEIEDHVLDPRNYPLAEISAAMEELKKHTGGEHESLAPTQEELAPLVQWVAEQPTDEFVVGPESHEKLTQELLDSPQGERLKKAMKEHEELGKKIAKSSSKVEYLLASALARYSHEMKHFQARKIFIHPREDDYYNDPEIKKSRPDADKAPYLAGQIWRRAAAVAEAAHEPVAYTHREIRNTLNVVITSEDDPAAHVKSLEPQQPQYRPLLKEYKRYRGIVKAGGWPEVKAVKNLNPGSKSETAKALKERLKIEGYFPENKAINDVYDADLEEAIKAYQETHQMPVTGKPHTMFWKSLNVPAERRLEQIRINVQRWRDTNIRHAEDEVYVFINVADFHAEIWENQELERRHRVVVGNNNRVCDSETKECENANRTPVPLAAYIDRAIYNPYWNVTPRIRKEEILPEVKKYVQAKYDKIKEKAAQQAMAPRISPLAPTEQTLTNSLGTGQAQPANDTLVGRPPVQAQPAQQPVQQPTQQGLGPLSPDAAAPSSDPLAGLPYYNPETGEIDVSTTDPENVPGWYAEHNYEVMYPGKSWEYVRMTPGAHNALGFVKIIFPNYYDVYLHDTNARALFGNDIRAYSHGCMRLQDPLGFAEWLLRRDNLYEKNNIPKILETGEYLPVFLERQIPVFVEYYTVRVDDNGRANFLADVYNYDDDPHLPPPPKKAVAAP